MIIIVDMKRITSKKEFKSSPEVILKCKLNLHSTECCETQRVTKKKLQCKRPEIAFKKEVNHKVDSNGFIISPKSKLKSLVILSANNIESKKDFKSKIEELQCKFKIYKESKELTLNKQKYTQENMNRNDCKNPGDKVISLSNNHRRRDLEIKILGLKAKKLYKQLHNKLAEDSNNIKELEREVPRVNSASEERMGDVFEFNKKDSEEFPLTSFHNTNPIEEKQAQEGLSELSISEVRKVSFTDEMCKRLRNILMTDEKLNSIKEMEEQVKRQYNVKVSEAKRSEGTENHKNWYLTKMNLLNSFKKKVVAKTLKHVANLIELEEDLKDNYTIQETFNSNSMKAKESVKEETEERKSETVLMEHKVDSIVNSIIADIIDTTVIPKREFPKQDVMYQRLRIPRGVHTELWSTELYIDDVFNEVMKDSEKFLASLIVPLNCDPEFILNQLQSDTGDYLGILDQQTTPSILPIELYFAIENKRQLQLIDSVNTTAEEKEMIQKCASIHDKCIFDAINDSLDYYRPYELKGSPVPWSKRIRQLTYRNGSTEVIQEVLLGAKTRVLIWAMINIGMPSSEDLSSLVDQLKDGTASMSRKKEEKLLEVITNEVKVLEKK